MVKPIFSTVTKSHVERIISRPPHGLLLQGADGAGKRYAARQIAYQLLGLTAEDKLTNHPYYLQIEPTKGVLGINDVRSLTRFMQLKTTGKAAIRRVAVVCDAHTMTIEAQNALLKIMEEPPADSVIILSAEGERSLLTTIYSRLHAVNLQPISFEEAKAVLPDINELELKKAYLLSGGNVGLLLALLDKSVEHPLVEAIGTAKSLLGETVYERLGRIDKLAKQKESCELLFDALSRIARAGLEQSVSSHKAQQVKRWHSIRQQVYDAKSSLSANPNLKLLLTDLFMSL